MAKISEALHLAADKYLFDGVVFVSNQWSWSCLAVEEACDELRINFTMVYRGLENMGLTPFGDGQFSGVKDKQGARYMWLKFAALMAEEQGV